MLVSVWLAAACNRQSAGTDHTAPAVGGSASSGAGAKGLANGAKVDGKQARALVAQRAQLVDVRSAEEFSAGHAEGAKNIPVDELEGRLGEVERGRPVVVYCRSGRRSGQATEVLMKSGYTVYNLGSLDAWNEP